MEYVSAISAIRKTRTGHGHTFHFVHPVVTAMLAACTLQRGERPDLVDFVAEARGYADHVGLIDAINGSYVFPSEGGRHGRTYSKLVKLAAHAEVDASNRVLGSFFREQLAGTSPEAAKQLTMVLGELHDNIASHAKGAGFSCAQVYNIGARKRIEFAVVDAGCGMLRNVQCVESGITSDDKAIQWCLERGNTSTLPVNDWAQRLPEDALVSPYPPDECITQCENHHVGEGLFQLSELIRILDGKMWIASGNGEIIHSSGQMQVQPTKFRWPGVAIECQIIVDPEQALEAQQYAELEELAERLGL